MVSQSHFAAPTAQDEATFTALDEGSRSPAIEKQNHLLAGRHGFGDGLR